jgi:hypothetical protein
MRIRHIHRMKKVYYMKRSLLARLRSNGSLYFISALLLLLGVPIYQVVVLGPTGFSAALNATGAGRYSAYLAWISIHNTDFLIYRALLVAAFSLILTLPFSLYRVIVAQEIMGQQERQAEEIEDDTQHSEEDDTEDTKQITANDGMPEHAWRGKGFVVLAAWLGLLGLAIYILATVASTFYLISAGNPYATGTTASSVASVTNIFAIMTNTIGTGLLGLGVLFFGAMISRTGRNLWPNSWVFFGYAALLIGALLCISAVAVVSTPGTGQSSLTTIATLLFAIWILWLAIMLVRLKPEA